VANQIYDRFKIAGKPLNEADIVIVDGADYHYYQVRIYKMYTSQLIISCIAPHRSRPGQSRTNPHSRGLNLNFLSSTGPLSRLV
jgi:hypothetical protein